MEVRRTRDFSKELELQERLTKKIETYRKLKRRIILLILLSFLLPLFLFFSIYPIHFYLLNGYSFYWGRFSVLIVLIAISFVLSIYFLHIRIYKKSEIETKLQDHFKHKYIRIGQLVIFHSHHKEELIEHELQIGKRTYCSGCYGTILGLLVNIIVSIIYLFYLNTSNLVIGIIVMTLGLAILGIGFLKYVIKPKGIFRLFLNIFPVIGTSALIIGSDLFFSSLATFVFELLIVISIFYLRYKIVRLDHQFEELYYDIKLRRI